MTDYLDDLDLTISTLWREERISCAHRDILRAYLEGGLPAGQAEYLRFHLEELRCPYCNANLADLGDEARQKRAEAARVAPPDGGAEERLLRSTRAYLRKVSGTEG